MLPPSRTATYIPDGANKVAVATGRLQSLLDAQRMTSPVEMGISEKVFREKYIA